jgi:hypothetical protein
VGSLAASMLSVALLAETLEARRSHPELYRSAELVLLASAITGLGVGLTGWGARASLEAMVVLLLAPVVAGLVVWLRRTQPETERVD